MRDELGRRALAAIVMLVPVAWLTLPLWWSSAAPRAADQGVEAPFVLAALVGLGCALAYAWSRGRQRQAQAVVLLAVANTLARPLLGAGQAGVEPVYVLPFLAGAYAGPTAGFLVGLSSSLASSALLGPLPASAASQAIVWAVIGAAGGLLRPLPRWAAAVLAAPLGLVTVAIASLGYDLPGWSVAPPTSATSFVPGIDPVDAFWRLLIHVLQTAWAVDAVRVLVTAIGLAVLAYPLLALLDHTFGGRRPDPRLGRVVRPLRAEAERRARRDHLSSLWPTTTKENPHGR